ncbi:MAG: DUF2933 domain-containing protein [Bradyrhizobiaceae bacterium]|nr:MAG: DUF2933 domain-containing protein [Bradyrhizobiaceae bacterium]
MKSLVEAVLSFIRARSGLLVCLVLAALGGYLLWSHTSHVLAPVPYLACVCPLMHFVGHGHRLHGRTDQPHIDS